MLVQVANTLLAFRVPRRHAVSPVAPGAPFRFSFFGWFYTPPPAGGGEAERDHVAAHGLIVGLLT